MLSDYYPFGLENNVVNGTEHKYKYNGKEIQEELCLNWYDYGARNFADDHTVLEIDEIGFLN